MEPFDELHVRRERLAALEKAGVEAYPSSAEPTHTIARAVAEFSSLMESKQPLTLAGRIMALRPHGGSTFLNIDDGTERIQIYLKLDDIGSEAYSFLENLDVADFIQATGTLFLTHRGERSLLVTEPIKLLAKALRPLPEKWHGLTDVETRYRERELDIVMNESVKMRFLARSRLVFALRTFLNELGFIEVETPILQSIPGGANARPFQTHHHALDIDLYLRIAPELYLKRMIVAGFQKVYEIGRSFRNEGIDHSHNPEFTSIELYWAYVDKETFVNFLEDVTRHIIREAVGKLNVEFEKSEIDFSGTWPRVTFRQSIIDACGIDIDKYTDIDSLLRAVKEKKLSIDFSGCVGIGEHYDQLFTKTARESFTQPTWVFDYPVELKPLARQSSKDSSRSASVQLVVCGMEVINAYYHELNNPVEQRNRFVEQQKLREQGSEVAQMIDESFLTSLEHGMPPTSGMAIGIDRLIALITNAASLKEVILFPTLRPKSE